MSILASQDILTRLLTLHPKAIDLSLGRMERLLAALGHPERALPPVIHVAGTNGKGSLVAFLRAMLEAQGLAVHVYTSPHLVRFHERIRLAGSLIEEDALAALLDECEYANDGLPITFFEITTAAAFLAFSRHRADILLLEVGLGGRLDATNVIDRPMLSAITPIDIDHREFLGPTVETIAAEKAGILKPFAPAVIGPQQASAHAVIKRIAAERGSPLLIHGRDWNFEPTGTGFAFIQGSQRKTFVGPALYGAHQIANASTAIACLKALPELGISDDAIQRGLLSVRWPARMQRLEHGPLVAQLPRGGELWLDGGHNPHAGRMIAQVCKEWRREDRLRPIHLILGMKANKDADGFLEPLSSAVDRIACIAIPDDANAFDAASLAALARGAHLDAFASPDLQSALADLTQDTPAPPRILIAGSLYLAGHVLIDHG